MESLNWAFIMTMTGDTSEQEHMIMIMKYKYKNTCAKTN